jgi:hypothetical protein
MKPKDAPCLSAIVGGHGTKEEKWRPKVFAEEVSLSLGQTIECLAPLSGRLLFKPSTQG